MSLSAWTWLIAEKDGSCIGYADGHSHRERIRGPHETTPQPGVERAVARILLGLPS
jgi:hypothetical protein